MGQTKSSSLRQLAESGWITAGSMLSQNLFNMLKLNTYVPTNDYLCAKPSSIGFGKHLNVSTKGYKNPDAMIGAINATKLGSLSIGGVFGKQTTAPRSAATFW